MDAAPAAPAQRHRHPLWMKVLAGLALLVAGLVLLVAFFPWDVLRGPVNRYVSEKTGRHFEITRKLDVELGRTTRVFADGIAFANPDWAQDRHLVQAEAAEIHVRLWPLLQRRIELPLIRLTKPQLGLQLEADGRRTWALGGDTSDERNFPLIGMLVVDEGNAHFVAPHKGADINTDFAIEGARQAAPEPGTVGPAMPLRFRARGTWQKEAFTAQGRTGNVLHLSGPLQQPFPAEVHAAAGQTRLVARGSAASLATLDGANVNFQLQGPNLAVLYKLVGVVLPETPRYAVAGQLSKQGEVWRARQLNGRLGDSDLTGELAFDQSAQVPLLTGQLRSRSLDFDDLAPLVGLAEQPSNRPGKQRVAAAPAQAKGKAVRDPDRKVLPTAPLDVSRLKAMNADVRFTAARVVNTPNLPLDRISTHVALKNGVLQLEPLDLGVAGGRVTGRLRIDSNSAPSAVEVKLDARALELGRLFPDNRLSQANVGKIHGEIDLKARGNTTAQMLGGSSGNVALLMGRGQISNLLLELAGLDGAEIVKFLLGGDTRVRLRCAAMAFDVNNGLMTSRAFVLDTADTVFYGNGSVNLATEAIDLTVRPYPKDMSILSLRSPLKVTGTLGAPQGGLERGALAGRAGLALALGAINPLLALAATIETGPGEDADCGAALREAAAPRAAAAVARTAPPPPGNKPGPDGKVMGAAQGPVQAQPQRKPAASGDPARSAEAGGP